MILINWNLRKEITEHVLYKKIRAFKKYVKFEVFNWQFFLQDSLNSNNWYFVRTITMKPY